MSASQTISGASPRGAELPADLPAGAPPESVRTVVTLVLLFHFFIVVVAVVGSSRAYSELVNRLVDRLVAQLYYPELLSLRSLSGAPYALTVGRESDEAAAEVVLHWESGDEARPDQVAAKEKLVFFDPNEVWLPIRRQRYLSYLRGMSEVATAEPPSPREVEMPMAVSRALLKRAGLPDGRHRFRLHRIATPSPEFRDDPPMPPLETIYEGNITVRDGRVDFTKADRAAASSPVVPAPTGGPSGGSPSGNPPLQTPPGAAPGNVPPLDRSPIIPPRDGSPLGRGSLLPPLDNPARSHGNR